jgi:hypothetical protein
MTKAPTVNKNWTRILLCLAASSPNRGTRLRDIDQAFAQRRTHVNVESFVKHPLSLGLSEEYVLVVMLPVYGLPEVALHWFLTWISISRGSVSRHRLWTAVYFQALGVFTDRRDGVPGVGRIDVVVDWRNA